MNSEISLPVNRIIPFSCVDGPGNRMVIFVQGCPLHCTYCHNPETINTCNNCGVCIPVCTSSALKKEEGRVIWKSENCSDCGACLKACPRLSSPKVKNYYLNELLEKIGTAAPFITGITVSGGEATLYAKELKELFRTVHREFPALNCFIDTNGALDLSTHNELIELCDGFMVDLKAAAPEEHQNIAGKDNFKILENIALLKNAGKLYEVRSVIAPGLDNKATIALGASLTGKDCLYKLIPYRSYGVRPDGLKFHGESGPDEKEMESYRRLAEASGACNIRVVNPGY